MYWMACSTRSVSSTERPKPRLLMVECCTKPSRSMMNRPRSAMPSPVSTPYASAISFFRSATSGYFRSPRPPSLRGVWIHARWVNWESTETPRISAPIFLNSSWRSLNAVISVGHTNVKSSG